MGKRVFTVLIILLLLFIWGNSCLPKQISSQESGRVTEVLRPLLETLFGEGRITEHFVRKLAHFTEYAALGCVSALWMLSLPVKTVWRIGYCAMGSLIVALLDETIQIFSGRGPMIRDVWLDFGGAICGGAIVFLIRYLISDKKRST